MARRFDNYVEGTDAVFDAAGVFSAAGSTTVTTAVSASTSTTVQADYSITASTTVTTGVAATAMTTGHVVAGTALFDNYDESGDAVLADPNTTPYTISATTTVSTAVAASNLTYEEGLRGFQVFDSPVFAPDQYYFTGSVNARIFFPGGTTVTTTVAATSLEYSAQTTDFVLSDPSVEVRAWPQASKMLYATGYSILGATSLSVTPDATLFYNGADFKQLNITGGTSVAVTPAATSLTFVDLSIQNLAIAGSTTVAPAISGTTTFVDNTPDTINYRITSGTTVTISINGTGLTLQSYLIPGTTRLLAKVGAVTSFDKYRLTDVNRPTLVSLTKDRHFTHL